MHQNKNPKFFMVQDIYERVQRGKDVVLKLFVELQGWLSRQEHCCSSEDPSSVSSLHPCWVVHTHLQYLHICTETYMYTPTHDKNHKNKSSKNLAEIHYEVLLRQYCCHTKLSKWNNTKLRNKLRLKSILVFLELWYSGGNVLLK